MRKYVIEMFTPTTSMPRVIIVYEDPIKEIHTK